MNKISFLVFWVLQHLACERQHSGFLDDSTATQTPTIKERASLCVKFCHFVLGFQRSFESVADTSPRISQIRGERKENDAICPLTGESSETLQPVCRSRAAWHQASLQKATKRHCAYNLFFSLVLKWFRESRDLLHCTFSFRHGQQPAWVSRSQNQQTFVGDEDGRRET